MKPTTFVGQTRILGAPSNWDADKMGRCEGLPVASDHACIYSQWSFNWSDRLKILFGKKLLLTVHARDMSPVAMGIAEYEPVLQRSDGIPRPSGPPHHRPCG